MKELLPQDNYELTFRDVLPIKSFTGNRIPLQEFREIKEDPEKDYARLAEMPLIPLKIVSATNIVTYAGIAAPIHGGEVSALSHFGASNKSFGYDWQDYINDEHSLYHPEMKREEKRLFDHRQIKNWEYFERIHERVTNAIKAYREGLIVPPPKLTPIIQFRKENDGLTMDFDLHPALIEHLKPEPWGYETPSVDSYLSELGPLVIAAYSPDVTQKWPRYDTYPGDCSSKNPMGATQFIPYSLWKADELITGEFARNFIHYCETGQLLPARIDETQLLDIQTELKNPLLPFPEEPNFGEDSVDTVWK